MSKFEYGVFFGGDEVFAVNAEKYNKEEAIELFEFEYNSSKVGEKKDEYTVEQLFVKHRAGINEDGEPCVGWWIEDFKRKGSCPAWVFIKNTN